MVIPMSLEITSYSGTEFEKCFVCLPNTDERANIEDTEGTLNVSQGTWRRGDGGGVHRKHKRYMCEREKKGTHERKKRLIGIPTLLTTNDHQSQHPLQGRARSET